MKDLIVHGGAGKTQRFPLRKDEVLIGRGADCDIRIDDPTISRHHARIKIRYHIKDESSRNGLWKDNKRYKKTSLSQEEDVSLGKNKKYTLRLVSAAPVEAADPDMTLPVSAQLSTEDLKGEKNYHDTKKKESQHQGNELELLKARCEELETELSTVEEENRFLRTALYPDSADRGQEVGGNQSEAVFRSARRSPASLRHPACDNEKRKGVQSAPVNGTAHLDKNLLERLIGIFLSNTDAANFHENVSDENLAYIVETLLKWGRDLERVTTRVAQGYAGVSSPMGTMLPEVKHNLSSLLEELLQSNGPAQQQALEQYLLHLRTWYVACLGGYRKAMEQWCPQFIEKLSPARIKERRQSNTLSRMLGLDELFYWKAFEEAMRGLKADDLIQEFEEHAAQAALEIAHKDREAPLGMSIC